MDKKVLVTGANGLIGLELCKQLKDDYHVVAIDNCFRSSTTPPCDELIKDSVQQYTYDNLNDFDYIFHMGNINGTKYFYDIPNRLIHNNITADLSIFEFAETNPSCKLIYASSSEVVAGTNSYPTKEDRDILIENIHNPRWSYRLGKLVGENYLKNSSIDHLILRFFNVWGERSFSGHFVADIKDKILNQDFTLVGGDETRSFCHVQDAVDAVLRIMDVSNRVINIGSDEEITIQDAANLIAESLGKHNIDWNVTKGLNGSVKRRKPDLSILKQFYPQYKPKAFNTYFRKQS